MIDKLIPLVAIVGPTASGKTALSIEIAKKFNGEIVSADSMQIYKGMDIASAKPTLEEMQGIKHHMMSFLELTQTFSVAQYCDMAKGVIEDIHRRGKLPVVVGGTGLYVDSLIENITFSESDCDEKLRAELQSEYNEFGFAHLINKLSAFDPESAARLEPTCNAKRAIRAIEIYHATGVTMTEHIAKSKSICSPYKVVKIGLKSCDRQFLYDRIDRRVDAMLNMGLVDEAAGCLNTQLSNTSAMAIGHKELIPYFNGETTLESCIDNLKRQTRRYAKRQLTWFKRDENISWFDIDILDFDTILEQTSHLIEEGLSLEQKS